jgi:hypothetical protein
MFSNSNSFGCAAGDLRVPVLAELFRPVVWQARPGRK